jgi:glucose/arabinose dehydrogenase
LGLGLSFAGIGPLAAQGSVPVAVESGIPSLLPTAEGVIQIEALTDRLHYPWSLVFLPDGDMLISEKHPGRLRRVSPDGKLSEPIAGLPPIFAEGNGGLLGLALDPDFARNRYVYFAFAEPGEPCAGIAAIMQMMAREIVKMPAAISQP